MVSKLHTVAQVLLGAPGAGNVNRLKIEAGFAIQAYVIVAYWTCFSVAFMCSLGSPMNVPDAGGLIRDTHYRGRPEVGRFGDR